MPAELPRKIRRVVPVSGGDGSEEGSMPVFVPGWNDGGRIIGIQGQIDLGSSILAAVKDREEG